VILDALEVIGHKTFEGDVWRVTRKGRDPLRGGSAGGRWSPPGEFEVLYTSLEKEGAEAEIGYRLSLEPVWPSRLEHEIHKIDLMLEQALRLADLTQLKPLGVDVAKYQSFEYEKTQAVASAAHFLEFDGLVVPSARHKCLNAVIFLDRLGRDGRLDVVETDEINWSDYYDEGSIPFTRSRP